MPEAAGPGVFSAAQLVRVSKLFASRPTHRLVILGLDGAGKTTLLFQWTLGEVVTTIPTIGFSAGCAPACSCTWAERRRGMLVRPGVRDQPVSVRLDLTPRWRVAPRGDPCARVRQTASLSKLRMPRG